MTHSKLLVSFCGVAALLLAVGCNRSAKEEENRAIQAQAQADQKIAQAQREADRKIAEAQNKAASEVAQTQDQAEKDRSKAQTSANETIRSANEQIMKTRMDLRAWVQEKLDALDKDVDSSKTKAVSASAKEKADFNRVLDDVESKRRALQGEIASIDSQSGSELDQLKARIAKELDAFKSSVQRLKATL